MLVRACITWVVWLGMSNVVHAEPAPSDEDRRVHFHGEVTLFGGGLWERDPVIAGEGGTSVVGARWALGALIGRADALQFRLGALFETFSAGSTAGAFGVELQLDAPTRQGVRLGGRVELASGNSGGCARCGDGTLLQLGPRARLGPVALGAELVTVHSSEYGSAYGFEVGVAVSGRPGKYALAASAIGGAVLGIAVLVLISQASTH